MYWLQCFIVVCVLVPIALFPFWIIKKIFDEELKKLEDFTKEQTDIVNELIKIQRDSFEGDIRYLETKSPPQ